MKLFLHLALLLLLPPLLPGVINRVKSIVGGRRGPPLLQLYFDLWKLLQKGAVYSTTNTWARPSRRPHWARQSKLLVQRALTWATACNLSSIFR